MVPEQPQRERQTVIRSIETANPPYGGSQAHAADFMSRIESLSPALRKRIPLIYERSGIDYRYTCIRDYATLDPDRFEFFQRNWSLQPPPTTKSRNQLYRESVLPLAQQAAERALEASRTHRTDITHLIAVSCTGFFAPGIDIELVRRLGLSPDVRRTMIGFMGCYAAFNALRVADSFCRSDADARVLVVCVELCTLHFQVEDSLESAVVNALFSDGAAAAVLASEDVDGRGRSLVYAGGRTMLDDDSIEDMTWEIGDAGFMMGLSSRVPGIIARHLPDYVDALAAPIGGRERVGFWAIHPGGRAIVEHAQDVLNLDDAAVEDSLEVLRLHGNMSSPTILFVLKRILDRIHQGTEPADAGLAMAFGPGLTLEGAAFAVA